ncbi:MAG TPA: cation diffusion facilitator family transporter [Gemmatimonadales bacterium]|nr:cation diffusion facilitator family transporter [Gemmatimonadales bacterium]
MQPTPSTPALCLIRVPRTYTRRLWWVLALTVVICGAEVAGAVISGSLALLADAGHMLADVAAIGLSLFTAWIAERPADATRTYGYLRWEILGAFINGAALFVIAGWIIAEAVGRLHAPPPVQGKVLFGVALLGLAANLGSLFTLHGGHTENLNVRAAYLHVLGDALGSIGALLAGVIILTSGWTLVDPIVSVGIALLVLVGAWRLVRESVDILLEGTPSHISLAEVEGRMRALPGVTAVHDLHVWTVTSGLVAMSGHAVVPDLGAHPEALTGIQRAMAALGIGHVTIQLETGGPCAEAEVAGPAAGHAHGHHHSHAGHHHH